MKKTTLFVAATVLIILTGVAQAASIVGRFSISGDHVITTPDWSSPTNISINPTAGDAMTTGAPSTFEGDFVSLLPAATVFYGNPGTVGAAPFNTDGTPPNNVSGGFFQGSMGGVTLPAGTMILGTDDGTAGQGGTGVRLFVQLTSPMTFYTTGVFMYAEATANFWTNQAGWDLTPGEVTFTSQQSGGSNDNTWSASFSTTPTTTSVPTLSTSVLIMLASLLMLVGLKFGFRGDRKK